MDNITKLIDTKSIRNAILSVYDTMPFKETIVGTNSYIGIDNGDPSNIDLKSKIYLGKRKKYHIASAPHEVPAYRSGKFYKSVNFLVRGVNRMEFGSEGVDYARYLEEGTSKMVARKPFEKTNKKNYELIKSMSTNNINNEIRKLGFRVTKIWKEYTLLIV